MTYYLYVILSKMVSSDKDILETLEAHLRHTDGPFQIDNDGSFPRDLWKKIVDQRGTWLFPDYPRGEKIFDYETTSVKNVGTHKLMLVELENDWSTSVEDADDSDDFVLPDFVYDKANQELVKTGEHLSDSNVVSEIKRLLGGRSYREVPFKLWWLQIDNTRLHIILHGHDWTHEADIGYFVFRWCDKLGLWVLYDEDTEWPVVLSFERYHV